MLSNVHNDCFYWNGTLLNAQIRLKSLEFGELGQFHPYSPRDSPLNIFLTFTIVVLFKTEFSLKRQELSWSAKQRMSPESNILGPQNDPSGDSHKVPRIHRPEARID
jgi:hypothetical protein